MIILKETIKDFLLDASSHLYKNFTRSSRDFRVK